jgi:Cu+-exporting ATPase
LLQVAAAVEVASEHPLARAVVDELSKRKLTVTHASEVRTEPGRGVRGSVDGT